MEIFNLFHGELDVEPDGNEPAGYDQVRAVRVGKKIGATQLGLSIYELPSGQAICPYHFEWTDEEWLIVLDGVPTLRTPAGERTLEPGDTVCFPGVPDVVRTVWPGGEADRVRRAALDEELHRHRRVPRQRQGRDLGRRHALHAPPLGAPRLLGRRALERDSTRRALESVRAASAIREEISERTLGQRTSTTISVLPSGSRNQKIGGTGSP